MSGSEIQKTRVINELRGFIRKLLQDPKILEQSLVIAREQLAEAIAQRQWRGLPTKFPTLPASIYRKIRPSTPRLINSF